MLTRLMYGIAIGALVAALADAQPLRWKFKPGNVYECERVVSQKQTVELKGKSFASEQRSTWVVRLDVIDTNADSARIRATLTKVESRSTPAAADEMLDPKLAEQMQGSTFELTVTPDGRVTKLAGYEDFLKRWAKDDRGKLKALRTAIAEEALRREFGDLFGPLPPTAVGEGGTWKREYVEPIPHFGSLRCTVNYDAAKTKDASARIDYSIQTKYQLPKDNLSVLFHVTKGNIASEKAAGRMVFDNATGCLVRHDRKLSLRGTLTLDVMERPQAMDFTSDSDVKIRIKASK